MSRLHMDHQGKNSPISTVAGMGMLLAFALILSYVESLIPFSFGIPGIKLGLANLAVVVGLYLIGTKEAFLIDFTRILLAGFLFGNLYSILYSMAGGIGSFLVMAVCKRSNAFSVKGVSMAGGVSHNAAQLAVAALVVETGSVLYYFPALLVAGLLTGFLIGVIAEQVERRII